MNVHDVQLAYANGDLVAAPDGCVGTLVCVLADCGLVLIERADGSIADGGNGWWARLSLVQLCPTTEQAARDLFDVTVHEADRVRRGRQRDAQRSYDTVYAMAVEQHLAIRKFLDATASPISP